jgi:deoxyxylulose-5-phosphate synthase
MMIRKPKYIDFENELRLLNTLKYQLLTHGLHAGNTVIVTVSTDYSSVVGQYLRHALTHEREICDGFGVDVPYPDEVWDARYIGGLKKALVSHRDLFHNNNKSLLLVEAGVIRGGNYQFVTNHLKEYIDNKVLTLALYENENSVFKSDYVGEYYNNTTEDLTFWWEEDNKHWD